jgi:hypothetical protein
MATDVDLLRRIARGETFKVNSYGSAEMAEFQLLADHLFELEGRALITIPRPAGLVSNSTSKEGGYTAISAKLAPAGQDLLDTIGG